ncbi:hypothetical protein FOA52_008097 [Chlamydomonas sp. UWO 241]|nr:hypothetical protein FOA52_008097 [Chlamydomonas sp. UWO 241]
MLSGSWRRGRRAGSDGGGPVREGDADWPHVQYVPIGSDGGHEGAGSPIRRNLSGLIQEGRPSCMGGVDSKAQAAVPGRAVLRHKKNRIVRWLVLHANGDKQFLTLDKRVLVQSFNLDITARDMRLLDSHFVNYETIGQISVRDTTIVFSMEHVKALIMADKVVIPLEEDTKSEVKERFIGFLEGMLRARAQREAAAGHAGDGHDAAGGSDSSQPLMERAVGHDRDRGRGAEPAPHGQEGRGHGRSGSNEAAIAAAAAGAAAAAAAAAHLDGYHGGDEDEALPFELCVMEAALSEICNHLAREVEILHRKCQSALEDFTEDLTVTICNHLAREVEILHQKCQSALEDLTKDADQPTLERVRRIKTGHQRLLTRVKLVREVLERLMEDDDDMLRCCLTRQAERKMAVMQATAVSNALHTATSNAQSSMPPFAPDPPPYTYTPSASTSAFGPASGIGRISTPTPDVHGSHARDGSGASDAYAAAGLGAAMSGTPSGSGGGGGSGGYGPFDASPSLLPEGSMPLYGAAVSPGRHGSQQWDGGRSMAHQSRIAAAAAATMQQQQQAAMAKEIAEEEEAHDLLDVENLIESYFMLVDSTFQRLETIGEYIDDTEDMTNIQLDYSRNKLIRFEIVLTTGTFALAMFSAIAGMLGENLVLPDIITSNMWGFAIVNAGCLAVCVLTFQGIYGILISRKLI